MFWYFFNEKVKTDLYIVSFTWKMSMNLRTIIDAIVSSKNLNTDVWTKSFHAQKVDFFAP